jgi:hypothetical protein
MREEGNQNVGKSSRERGKRGSLRGNRGGRGNGIWLNFRCASKTIGFRFEMYKVLQINFVRGLWQFEFQGMSE